MIQRTIKVKSAETLPTKDQKKTYLSVVLTDGQRDNKYSIFEPSLQKTLQDAHKSGESVNVGLEKEGNFWNVKSAEITSEGVKSTEPKPNGQKQTDKADEILLSVAFKGACECEGYWFVLDGNPHNARVLQSTETYYDGLKAILSGNRVVLEAIKMGGQVKKDA